jgi:hypothetical protein
MLSQKKESVGILFGEFDHIYIGRHIRDRCISEHPQSEVIVQKGKTVDILVGMFSLRS